MRQRKEKIYRKIKKHVKFFQPSQYNESVRGETLGKGTEEIEEEEMTGLKTKTGDYNKIYIKSLIYKSSPKVPKKLKA